MESVYELSNKQTEVKFKSFDKKYTDKLLKSKSIDERYKNGQSLLIYLCDKYKINRVSLSVLDRKQKISGRGHICGFYCRNNLSITIYNKTAKMGKEVAIKQFYDTLLHEFMHHYDLNVLKMNDTLHTSGFYKRISDLKTKL